ncbi:sensor histidine kinase [Paenibacillus sinopodophylli]|uniref:sensor histidine kinase n=1 Tax=Paenibacillus sinopodophylli TaxID=1837342 RepID=UPI00110CEF6A|nr:sensor histidine kinase [Paenibacillus sinopodophylli]
MKRTSIRYRLMVLMICLTTLPVLTVTWIAMNNTRSSVEKEIIEANRSRMLSADQYLDEVIRQIEVLFYSLQVNQPLLDGLNMLDSQSGAAQFRTQKYMQDTLTQAYYANSKKIDELALYTHESQKVYSVNNESSGLSYSLDIRTGSWSRMLSAPIHMYFKESGNGIYAFHSINRFADRHLLGGLSVRINEEVWKSVGAILQSEANSSVFLVNDEGEQLTGAAPLQGMKSFAELIGLEGRLNKELQIKKTDSHYLFIKRVDDGELALIKALPITAITESANNTVRAGIVTGLLFALASILLSIMVSLRITRPIVRLARTMRMASIQQFELTSVSNDEIGLLERGYNSMMQRMKELIENEYRKEIEVKDAQLMALQAQINPHFLNNTLNLIGGMALVKGAPEIYKLTNVIGDLLRYSISSGNDAAALDDELKHIRNYLFIQEQRFAGRCTVKMEYDGTVAGIELPRFTLQPLVENAFEHGLQPKEGNWEILIRVSVRQNDCMIMIKDNGAGMDKARLSAIRNKLRESFTIREEPPDDAKGKPRSSKGIGLMNVNARLKLHYGKRASLRIFSRSNQGTIIAIKLPVPRREDAHA